MKKKGEIKGEVCDSFLQIFISFLYKFTSFYKNKNKRKDCYQIKSINQPIIQLTTLMYNLNK